MTSFFIFTFVAFIIIYGLGKFVLPNFKNPEPEKEERLPLSYAEKEMIWQATRAFDFKTKLEIEAGCYHGKLPEDIGMGHYSNMYPHLYQTKIAGINMRQGLSDLIGEYFDARLVAEPENPHDKNAIKIINAEDYRHLGYIPASETASVRDFIDGRFPYPCKAHIEEHEDWDEKREKPYYYLVGQINIENKNKTVNY